MGRVYLHVFLAKNLGAITKIIERFGYEDYTPEILHWSDPIDEFFVKYNL